MVLDLELRLSSIQVPGDCECIDDDVVICSPRSFAEAREKSRRIHGPIEVFNVETESRRGFSARLSTGGNRPRRTPAKQRTAAGNFSILEGHETTKSVNVAMPEELPLFVPQSKAPTFNCPVCIGHIVEETSTKCGHIFCKECILTALAVQKKCPTCRRKLKMRDTFRIYFPASD